MSCLIIEALLLVFPNYNNCIFFFFQFQRKGDLMTKVIILQMIIWYGWSHDMGDHVSGELFTELTLGVRDTG